MRKYDLSERNAFLFRPSSVSPEGGSVCPVVNDSSYIRVNVPHSATRQGWRGYIALGARFGAFVSQELYRKTRKFPIGAPCF